MTLPPKAVADQAACAPDILSEVLRTVRLKGSVFMDGRFAASFGVISPALWDAIQPIRSRSSRGGKGGGTGFGFVMLASIGRARP